ncbi:uncharacterized protein LOC110094449 isoform X1 [Dendrobium catenatum]|uniref:Uncharacterized protein n=1 Tax=Dendrobium catenatum TaxID=906689 RepID=A0A2I0WAE7_9ASPA|nr:uncharacterized protein LOC110094449 isoform X1 [Dendrobium catenatum]PKU72631.1 hypothetical protein MA16_Dca010201 [Dendrobium catenatum]
MAKLSTARDFRSYGPPTARNRWEYANAGIYIVAAVLLFGGFLAQQSPTGFDGRSGLAVIIIGLFLIAAVNAHDLIAHLTGFDFSLPLIEFDAQLALVEIAVPIVLFVGDILTAVAVIFLLAQMERGHYNWSLEKHAVNLLIAGPVFWLLGSVHDLCQVYERSNGLLQLLQKSVQIPFLMGSLLFLVGGIFNRYEIFGQIHHHSFKLVGENWVWLSLFGSLLFLIGGLMNVVKVFKMQQMDRGGLESLRGGALDRLIREREGRVPLILEGSRRRDQSSEESMPASTAPMPTHPSVGGGNGGAKSKPYKDVLVGGGGGV